MHQITKTFALFISTFLAISLAAQTPNLEFDGESDYVFLPASAANGVRTVECWFKLNEVIDSTLEVFQMICSREVSPSNENEWHLSFASINGRVNPGKLRFAVVETLHGVYDVFSNDNSWEVDRWYHVAGVVHPTLGMMLFIDGIKQDDVLPSFNRSTADMNDGLLLASHDGFSDRYFNGHLEDFHVAKSALYTDNFIPPCPNRLATSSTIGLWNFNEVSGFVVVDSSGNGNHGSIVGCTRANDTICGSEAAPSVVVCGPASIECAILPNPSVGIFNFTTSFSADNIKSFTILNSLGQVVLQLQPKTSKFSVDLSHLPGQVLHYRLLTISEKQFTGKFIKAD